MEPNPNPTPTPLEGTPIVPAPTAEPTPALPPDGQANFQDGGQTDTTLTEKLFGKSTGELGFTGIFIFALFSTACVYNILYLRKRLTALGEINGLKSRVAKLEKSLSAQE